MCEEAGSKLIHLGFNLLERANINNVGLILRTMIKLADTAENSSKFVTPKYNENNSILIYIYFNFNCLGYFTKMECIRSRLGV